MLKINVKQFLEINKTKYDYLIILDGKEDLSFINTKLKIKLLLLKISDRNYY